MIKFTTKVTNEGTAIISISFFDEQVPPQPATPKTMKWSLTNVQGIVINDRYNVDVSPLASTIELVLKGADLDQNDGFTRIISLNGTYDSTVENDLPLPGQIEFLINKWTEVIPPTP